MDEDKGYEVVDKRAAKQEAAEPDPKPEEPTDKKVEEPVTEGTGEQAEASVSQGVYTMLGLVTSMLIDYAWLWMGLRMDPESKETKKDMVMAKMAIDTLIYLANIITPRMEENEQRELQNTISNLQINFVQQSAKGE